MRRTLTAVTAVLMLLLAACGGGTETASPDGGEQPVDGAGATDGATPEGSGTQEAAPEGGDAGGEPRNLTFATGRQGGSQYPISVALVQIMEGIPSLGTLTLTPGGGAANVVAVNEGQSQLGITLALSAVDGAQGNPPYEQPLENVQHLFSLHPFNLVIVVAADSDIDSVEDLRGRSVNVGPAGFTTGVVAQMLFEVAGIAPSEIDIRNLDITDASDQFRNGQLDALLYMPSDRMAPYIDLAQARDLKIVPLGDELIQGLLDRHPSFRETTWPPEAGVYQGLDEPVPTVGFNNTIIVNGEQVGEQLGYDMVKAVADNFDQLTAVEASFEVLEPADLAVPVRGMPLHPGAERYFQEQGWTQQ